MRLIFGLCLVVAGLVALGADVWAGPLSDQSFRLQAIGEHWRALHQTSLIGLNSFTEKQVSPDFFDTVLLPILRLPTAPVLIGLGVLLLLLARIGRRRRRDTR